MEGGLEGARQEAWSLAGGWDIIQDERAQGKVVAEGNGDEMRQEVALSESSDWLENREASSRERVYLLQVWVLFGRLWAVALSSKARAWEPGPSR